MCLACVIIYLLSLFPLVHSQLVQHIACCYCVVKHKEIFSCSQSPARKQRCLNVLLLHQ